jgi:hypothetical protein
MTATVSSKQGVVREVLVGPWRREGDAWIVDTEAGPASITVMGGCGCGGSSSVEKMAAGAAPGQGFLP